MDKCLDEMSHITNVSLITNVAVIMNVAITSADVQLEIEQRMMHIKTDKCIHIGISTAIERKKTKVSQKIIFTLLTDCLPENHYAYPD